MEVEYKTRVAEVEAVDGAMEKWECSVEVVYGKVKAAKRGWQWRQRKKKVADDEWESEVGCAVTLEDWNRQ